MRTQRSIVKLIVSTTRSPVSIFGLDLFVLIFFNSLWALLRALCWSFFWFFFVLVFFKFPLSTTRSPVSIIFVSFSSFFVFFQFVFSSTRGPESIILMFLFWSNFISEESYLGYHHCHQKDRVKNLNWWNNPIHSDGSNSQGLWLNHSGKRSSDQEAMF